MWYYFLWCQEQCNISKKKFSLPRINRFNIIVYTQDNITGKSKYQHKNIFFKLKLLFFFFKYFFASYFHTVIMKKWVFCGMILMRMAIAMWCQLKYVFVRVCPATNTLYKQKHMIYDSHVRTWKKKKKRELPNK